MDIWNNPAESGRNADTESCGNEGWRTPFKERLG